MNRIIDFIKLNFRSFKVFESSIIFTVVKGLDLSVGKNDSYELKFKRVETNGYIIKEKIIITSKSDDEIIQKITTLVKHGHILKRELKNHINDFTANI